LSNIGFWCPRGNFSRMFDSILARAASCERVYSLESNFNHPPMIKRAFRSSLILALALTPFAAKAEKLVINSNQSDPAPKETYTKLVISGLTLGAVK
jgi:hypothetical protein